MEACEVAIIGAGPAGMAAAVQLARYGITPLIFEKGEAGGLLRNAHLVENYPGFPEGIGGGELADLMRDHLGRSGAEVRQEKVVSLDHGDGRFFLKTTRAEYTTGVAVVASGTEPRKIPGLAIPDDIMDRVHYEVHPIRDACYKNIAIIGAGDAAFDYALNLSHRNEVTLLSRSRSAKCNRRLWDKATSSLHISLMRRVVVEKVIGRAGKLLISCGHLDGSDMTTLTVDYLVIAVGREPGTRFFGLGLAEQVAYLSLKNELYMIGDVKNGLCRQVAISVGNGVEAAMRIAEHMGA